jgi:hypothetical protein
LTEKKLSKFQTRTSFRDPTNRRFEIPVISVRSSSSCKDDVRYLEKLRKYSYHKKLVCQNGPSCQNHDWDKKSPIVKVCRRDEKCVNHDWKNVDRESSPFKVVCQKGPGCKNHNWGDRSPMVSMSKPPLAKSNKRLSNVMSENNLKAEKQTLNYVQ